MTKPLAVIAIGGNSLIKSKDKVSIADQEKALAETLEHVVDMIAEGWQTVITHGNGPQVGYILQRAELAETKAGVHGVPLVIAVADTQGSIGYQIQIVLDNIMRRRGMPSKSVSVLTLVKVDRNDPGLKDPQKYVGEFYDEADVPSVRAAHPEWILKKDSNRGWRRVVPSPKPLDILNMGAIHTLVNNGYHVVACGGGGVPVVTGDDGNDYGLDAVIDKDLASSLLALDLKASVLIISTGVEQVALDFGTPKERRLGTVTLEETRRYYNEGQFPAGSMGPKILAAMDFLENGGEKVIITNPENLLEAVRGRTGTHIVK